MHFAENLSLNTGPEVSGTNATDFDLFPFALFCADPRVALIDQM